VPTEVLARFVDSCREPDRCACRKDDERPPLRPVARRVDCCAAPPAIDRVGTAAVAVPPSTMLPAPATAELPATVLARRPGSVPGKPRARTRGPPGRLFASFERWLI